MPARVRHNRALHSGRSGYFKVSWPFRGNFLEREGLWLSRNSSEGRYIEFIRPVTSTEAMQSSADLPASPAGAPATGTATSSATSKREKAASVVAAQPGAKKEPSDEQLNPSRSKKWRARVLDGVHAELIVDQIVNYGMRPAQIMAIRGSGTKAKFRVRFLMNIADGRSSAAGDDILASHSDLQPFKPVDIPRLPDLISASTPVGAKIWSHGDHTATSVLLGQ